jgi:hypothetical protein
MQYILYGLELLAGIIGFVYWQRVKNSYWKWFPVYLAFIILGEMAGNYLNHTKEYLLKRDMINYIVIPAEFIFFYWVYLQNANTQKRKYLILSCFLVYLLSFIADQLFFSGKKLFFLSFSYSIGNLTLLVAIIAFYIQLAGSNDIMQFKKIRLFWVSLGLLIFYLGTLPYFGLFRLLFYEFKSTYVIYTYVMFACNWIMYILFTISFIWARPK